MNKITKNTLLAHFSNNIQIEKTVNPHRVWNFNQNKIKKGLIVYLIERELRFDDNFAFDFAMRTAQELNSKIKIIHLKKNYEIKKKNYFITSQISKCKKKFIMNGFDFEFFANPKEYLLEYLYSLNTGILIIDFNPIIDYSFLKKASFKIYEIDGHNIFPSRFISTKQEYNAASLRRKFYFSAEEFLKEPLKLTPNNNLINDFIENKLPYYAEFKNNPNKEITSNLSKYLNLGFISSQRLAIEVIKSNVSNENKEVFLEELIIRKELSDNFCLYCKSFKTFSCIPKWAKESLEKHKKDLRIYNYSLNDFEDAKTHDNLWNAIQKQLLKEGIIHGYLRMYWAKKILEWSNSPEFALRNAIYLNDKYAFDAPSSNGYVGILWAIGGLHDRAFQERFVTGKIRSMTYNGAKSKFNIQEYIQKYI